MDAFELHAEDTGEFAEEASDDDDYEEVQREKKALSVGTEPPLKRPKILDEDLNFKKIEEMMMLAEELPDQDDSDEEEQKDYEDDTKLVQTTPSAEEVVMASAISQEEIEKLRIIIATQPLTLREPYFRAPSIALKVESPLPSEEPVPDPAPSLSEPRDPRKRSATDKVASGLVDSANRSGSFFERVAAQQGRKPSVPRASTEAVSVSPKEKKPSILDRLSDPRKNR